MRWKPCDLNGSHIQVVSYLSRPNIHMQASETKNWHPSCGSGKGTNLRFNGPFSLMCSRYDVFEEQNGTFLLVVQLIAKNFFDFLVAEAQLILSVHMCP